MLRFLLLPFSVFGYGYLIDVVGFVVCLFDCIFIFLEGSRVGVGLMDTVPAEAQD